MAIMYNCAIDTTLDLAYNDAKVAKAVPKGVRRQIKTGKDLWSVLKAEYRDYNDIDWGFASDVYKDIYGQRPHFDDYCWSILLGIEGNGPIFKEACENAANARKRLREAC